MRPASRKPRSRSRPMPTCPMSRRRPRGSRPRTGRRRLGQRREAAMAYEIEIEEVEYLRHGSTPYIARMFKPRGAGPFPAVIDGHGGAWQGGDRFANDPINEAVAKGGV